MPLFSNIILLSFQAPERQRIVFAGQLLRDDARLADYFSRYDQPEPYVLHLVYTASIEENVAAAERRAKETELRQRKPFTSSSLATLDQQNQSSASSFPSASPYPQYWPWIGGQQVQMGATPDAANDWMRQQQQMYAAMNAMMSQWYGQYLQAYGGTMGFYPASPVQQPAFDFSGQQPQVEPPAAAQQQEAPRAQGQPQQAMNAQVRVAASLLLRGAEALRDESWVRVFHHVCVLGWSRCSGRYGRGRPA